MSKAIESIREWEDSQRLVRLADMQAYFIQRYAALIEDPREKYNLERDLAQIIHLTYREAQQPLMQQMTDFVLAHTQPLILERK